jgi:hypothetical protein
MKNHEDNFDELHMETVDTDFISAYNSAIAVPDMWDRISAGFDAEQLNAQQEKADISADNKNRKNYKKLSHYRGWLGLAAAVLLVCIIAVPLIRNGIIRNDKNYKNDIAEEAVMEDSYAESYDDEVAESEDESYDADTNKAVAGQYDGYAYDSEAADVDADSAVSASVDESAVACELEVSGSITRTGDEYILTVSAVLDRTNSSYVIKENDRLQITNAEDELSLDESLDDGETISYDTIRLDNLEPLDTNADVSYTAELVTLN